ncbi:MAG: zinc ribbon domain-containing protein [Proteobacteria bacterium]|nr:zinc ribbon domain-containing protein [Pseudomonadota bacterium]
MAVYEMFWDCPSCGTRKLLGKSHRHCPSCGAAQDPKRRYFPPEHEKVAVHDHVFVGVDLICAHCETPNSAAAAHCVNCGGPIGDGDDPEVQLIRENALEELGKHTPPPPSRLPSRMTVLGVLAFFVFTFFCCCCITVFWTRDGEVELVGREWERAIEIEQYASRSDGDWCDSMPHDAYSVSRSERQRGSNSIPDGESCSTVNSDNGDGTYTQSEVCTTTYREEPIYDTWCSYTVDRWGTDHWETARGTQADRPHWPGVSVTNCASLGCTREGSRTQVYRMLVKEIGGDADGSCDVEEARWMRVTEGSRFYVEVGVIDGGVRCHTLRQL